MQKEEKAMGLMNKWVSTKQMLRLGLQKYIKYLIYLEINQ